MFIPFLAKKILHTQVAFSVTLTTLLSKTESGMVEQAAPYQTSVAFTVSLTEFLNCIN
jgi:uncharacterized membrane protein